jgi:hypothetical protein
VSFLLADVRAPVRRSDIASEKEIKMTDEKSKFVATYLDELVKNTSEEVANVVIEHFRLLEKEVNQNFVENTFGGNKAFGDKIFDAVSDALDRVLAPPLGLIKLSRRS